MTVTCIVVVVHIVGLILCLIEFLKGKITRLRGMKYSEPQTNIQRVQCSIDCTVDRTTDRLLGWHNHFPKK